MQGARRKTRDREIRRANGVVEWQTKGILTDWAGNAADSAVGLVSMFGQWWARWRAGDDDD